MAGHEVKLIYSKGILNDKGAALTVGGEGNINLYNDAAFPWNELNRCSCALWGQ
jgi:hypothetical protein